MVFCESRDGSPHVFPVRNVLSTTLRFHLRWLVPGREEVRGRVERPQPGAESRQSGGLRDPLVGYDGSTSGRRDGPGRGRRRRPRRARSDVTAGRSPVGEDPRNRRTSPLFHYEFLGSRTRGGVSSPSVPTTGGVGKGTDGTGPGEWGRKPSRPRRGTVGGRRGRRGERQRSGIPTTVVDSARGGTTGGDLPPGSALRYGRVPTTPLLPR